MGQMAELIEKAKKRRVEIAIAKAQHAEEFDLELAKRRSEGRLWEGRAKLINVWSINLQVKTNEPYLIYKGLTLKELEELRSDMIKIMNMELIQPSPTHVEYWEAMMVVCDWEICEARKREVLARAYVLARTRVQGQESSRRLVAEDLRELAVEALRLGLPKAKARLREIHGEFLRQTLQRLRDSDEEEDHRCQGQSEHKDPAQRDGEEPGVYPEKVEADQRRKRNWTSLQSSILERHL